MKSPEVMTSNLKYIYIHTYTQTYIHTYIPKKGVTISHSGIPINKYGRAEGHLESPVGKHHSKTLTDKIH